MADNPLSSVKSEHIDVRWLFIRDLVKTKMITVTHICGQDFSLLIFLRRRCLFRCFKGIGRGT